MIKSATLIFFLILLQPAFSQLSGLELADQLYEKQLYLQAEKRYSKLFARKELSDIDRFKWAKCLYVTGQYEQAEKQLESLVSHPGASPDDLMMYVHCLKRKEQYTKADRWMKVYAQRNRTDVRTKSYNNNPNYLYDILKQDKYFEIYELKASSRGVDYGAVPYPGTFDVYLLSSRRKPKVKHYSWSVVQKPSYQVFEAKQGPKFQLVSPKIFDKKMHREFEYGPMCFTNNGEWVFFTRRKNLSWRTALALSDETPRWKICVARILPDGTWGGARELAICSNDYSVGHPALSPSEDKLIYVSDQSGGVGQTDLYQMPIEILETGIIEGKSENLGRLVNTEGEELFPWFDESGNLYFSSDGHVGFGGQDVFIAFQNSFGYQSVMNLGQPINSAFNDYGLTWSEDGYSGHFSSDRNRKNTGDDLFSFEKVKSLDKHFVFEGVVTDVDRGFPLRGAIAVLYDEFDLKIGEDTTDRNGQFLFNLETKKPYSVRVRAKGYHDSLMPFLPLSEVPPLGTCEEQIPLKLNPELHLSFVVTEKQTGKPLSDVLVHVIDMRKGQEVFLMRTDENGKIRRKLPRSYFEQCLDYKVVLEKGGYLAQTFNFYHCIKSFGDIYVNDYDPMQMIRFENGLQLQDLMNWPKINVQDIEREPTAEIKALLLQIVDLANANPGMKIEFGVYESCENGLIQAERVSERKAKYLADWVKGRSYSPGQIRYRGFGFKKPVVECSCDSVEETSCTEAMHQENRRVVVRILK